MSRARLRTRRATPGAPVIHFGTETVDFYDIKATAETVLRELRRFDVEMTAVDNLPEYVEGSAYLELHTGGKTVGGLGLLSPVV